MAITWRSLIFALTLLTAPLARAGEAEDLLARFKTASGGARWDAVTRLESRGTLETAGLSGPLAMTEDLIGGRNVARYELGPLKGASGYDGTLGWEQDGSGEVTSLDAPSARARTASEAWLTRRAYWYPARQAARYGKVGTRVAEGHEFRVVEATPADGVPIALWFDAQTGLLARTEFKDGSQIVLTRYEDWRESGGLRLPFRVISLRGGDVRNQTLIRWQTVARDAQVAADAFAVPKMDTGNAKIDAPDGTTRIPFELLNNHIYATATVDGQTLRLLVDTGGLNALSPAATQRLGLAMEGELAAQGVGEKSAEVRFARARRLELGAMHFDSPLFYVTDLGEIAKSEGQSFDGLVGYEVFRRFSVTIDYAGHMLMLTDPARFAPPAGASALDFTLADREPIVTGTLDGMPVRIGIDTGSRASLDMHAPFAHRQKLKERYQPRFETVIGWGVGGPSRAWPVRFETLELGGHEVHGVVGGLFVGDKGAFAEDDMDLNLGGGVLRRFTVGFDYTHRKMYLAPNDASAMADDYDRSGLWLMQDGERLRVGAVTSKGPADKAGVQAEDRIRAIDGEAVTARPLAAWRERLRMLPAGRVLVLDIERAGAPRTLRLELEDLVLPANQHLGAN